MKPLLSREEIEVVAQIAHDSFKEDPWLGIIEASIDGTPVVFEHNILKSVLGMEAGLIQSLSKWLISVVAVPSPAVS